MGTHEPFFLITIKIINIFYSLKSQLPNRQIHRVVTTCLNNLQINRARTNLYDMLIQLAIRHYWPKDRSGAIIDKEKLDLVCQHMLGITRSAKNRLVAPKKTNGMEKYNTAHKYFNIDLSSTHPLKDWRCALDNVPETDSDILMYVQINYSLHGFP